MGYSVYKRGKATPYIGAAHASDIAEFYGFGTQPDLIGMDAISERLLDSLHSDVNSFEVNFANTLDPNTKNTKSLLSKINWPRWESSAVAPPLFTFVDPAPAVNITFDTFRTKEIDLLITIALKLFGWVWCSNIEAEVAGRGIISRIDVKLSRGICCKYLMFRESIFRRKEVTGVYSFPPIAICNSWLAGCAQTFVTGLYNVCRYFEKCRIRLQSRWTLR